MTLHHTQKTVRKQRSPQARLGPKKHIHVGSDQREFPFVQERTTHDVDHILTDISEVQSYLRADDLLLDFIEGDEKHVCDWEVMGASIIAFLQEKTNLDGDTLSRMITIDFLQSLFLDPILDMLLRDPNFEEKYIRHEEYLDWHGVMQHLSRELRSWGFSETYADVDIGHIRAVYMGNYKTTCT